MSSTSERWLVFGVLAPCACASNPSHVEVAKAEPAADETTASEAIAEARCAREVSCNNVGIDKRYVSLEDCLTRVWTSSHGDAVESECQNGLDEAQLDACLTDIRVLECSVQLESLELLPACAASLLCSE
jgi:hypothetical protein